MCAQMKTRGFLPCPIYKERKMLLNYEEFKKQLVREIRTHAAEDVEIAICEIPKNNGVICEAVTLRRRGNRMAPAFYFEEYYDLCCEGETPEVIAAGILEQFEREIPADVFSTEFFMNWENVKRRIYPKLINYEMNRVQLEGMPHMKWMDLAVVFFCWLKEDVLENATVMIRNEHVGIWGVSCGQLSGAAMENAQRDLPPYFGGLGELTGIVGEEQEAGRPLPMYVLTNRKEQFGAACLLYPGMLERLSGRIRSDYYILPSSIHECIIVPVSGQFSSSELKDIVTEINKKFVHPQEVLADTVYEYSQKERRLIMR